MSWLTRYQAGECEAVWAELGARALAGEDRAAAVEVAIETMRRAKACLEQLSERLSADGYVFLYEAEVLVPPERDLPAQLESLEKKAGPIPLALRAFWEQVGSVNFIGAHPRWPLPAYIGLPGLPAPKSTDPRHLLYADPLMVAGAEFSLQDYEGNWAARVEEGEIDPEEEPYEFGIGPDALHKANVSGGLQTVAPAAVADPPLLGLHTGSQSFVSYLRSALANAGFAGFPHRTDPAERAELSAWAKKITAGLQQI